MIVYIPTPITSVEQAEQLPVGTIAIDSDHQELAEATSYGPGRTMIRCRHWEPTCTWHSDWEGAVTHEHVIGWTALVPVEADEETRIDRPGRRGISPVRRFVTLWESIGGPSRDRRGGCA